jgi:hypothetical protein
MTPPPFRLLLRAALCLGMTGCTLELTGVPIDDSAQTGDGDGDTDDGNPDDGGGDGDLGADMNFELCTRIKIERGEDVRVEDKVDLLFVVDNSGSMQEEQEKLAAALPTLVETLLDGRLPDSAESLDFVPARSLHIAVVSTDMGSDGAFGAGGCEGLGDDGLFQPAQLDPDRLDDPQCQLEPFAGDSYLAYDIDAGSSEYDAVQEVQCMAPLGTAGCGFEQPLEAMWKALAPSSDSSFVSGSGHGEGGEHTGFLRDDAVLAIVHLSDEDDCSITKAGRALFDPASSDARFTFEGEPAELKGKVEGVQFRCAHEATEPDSAELLSDVERFVQGLISLKKEREDKIVMLSIVGIPAEAESMGGGMGQSDFAAILDLPAMQITPGLRACSADEQLNDPEGTCGKPALDALPAPACTGVGGSASPARRFVEMARAFEDQTFSQRTMVRSVCADDYGEALLGLAEKIGANLDLPCLNSTIKRHIADCELIAALPEGQSGCDGQKGRYFREVRTFDTNEGPTTRTLCTINRVFMDQDDELSPNPNAPSGVNGAAGWYYDASSVEVRATCESGARLVLTDDAELGAGEVSFVSCVIQPEPGYEALIEESIGAPCDRDQPDETIAYRECPGEYRGEAACEAESRTCQLTCSSDRPCPGFTSDLGAYVSLCVPTTCPFVPLDER